MHAFKCLALLLPITLVAALENPHERAGKYAKKSSIPPIYARDAPRARSTSTFLNRETQSIYPAVNGSALPDVDFNIGESYAGTLPITSNTNDPNQLWFWFFPSSNPLASNEITIWLNGGPGCSSLDGLLQENGKTHVTTSGSTFLTLIFRAIFMAVRNLRPNRESIQLG
jgi:carboxypeptidase D